MNTKNPTIGLLVYAFHSVSGNLAVGVAVCAALAVALLVTGEEVFFLLLAMATLMGPSMMTLFSMASISKWECFQLTMPVTRGNLVSSQYLQIFLSSLVGVAFLTVIAGIAMVVYSDLFAFFRFSYDTLNINLSEFWALPIMASGLMFPLASTRFGEKRETAIAIICFIAANMLINRIPQIGANLGFSAGIIWLLIIAVTLVIYIVSYFITRRLYAVRDF